MSDDDRDLTTVDWADIPAPEDDGAAQHLDGRPLPPIALAATDGRTIDLSSLTGRHVIYAYPMTGRPGVDLPEGWDQIPGARGCTPQSCAFRDHLSELQSLGVSEVFGLSTQSTDYQAEAVERLHLPFALLSDMDLEFTRALELPTMAVAGMTLLRRLTMIVDDGRINRVFYPVFPPDKNPAEVMAWLGT